MKDYVCEEEFGYFERVLKNYYHLKRKEQRLLREVMELEMKLEDERQASGISYDGISGTYNNTDTPYICSLVNNKVSIEKEAETVKKEHIRLNKYNKIDKRIGVLTYDQKETVYALCRRNMNKTDYAKELNISRQAVDDRYKVAFTKMLEVE